MMKNAITAVCMVLVNGALLAAPAQKSNPVAEGYPDWQGLSAKSFVAGREISPSDLRHKVTIVIEVDDNEKAQSQLASAQGLIFSTGIGRLGSGQNWETLTMPRWAIAAVSVHGAKNAAAFLEGLKRKSDNQSIQTGMQAVLGQGCSVYQNLTFTGAPDSTGKRPYVYIMGPEGTKPVFKGELNAANIGKAMATVNKLRKQVEASGWQPFYGSVKEPKFFPKLAQALEKGKTLAPVEKEIVKEVVSKDPERPRRRRFSTMRSSRRVVTLLRASRWRPGRVRTARPMTFSSFSSTGRRRRRTSRLHPQESRVSLMPRCWPKSFVESWSLMIQILSASLQETQKKSSPSLIRRRNRLKS